VKADIAGVAVALALEELTLTPEIGDTPSDSARARTSPPPAIVRSRPAATFPLLPT